MKIYLAGVSRVVRLEKFLVKRNAGRLLSFYYENDNKKCTKAFRVWEMMKMNPGKEGENLVKEAWPLDSENPNTPNRTYADRDKKTVPMSIFDTIRDTPRATLKRPVSEPKIEELGKTIKEEKLKKRKDTTLRRSKQIYDVDEDEIGLEEFPEDPLYISDEDPDDA